jgi:tRNA (mo5U34)-methyltransferase
MGFNQNQPFNERFKLEIPEGEYLDVLEFKQWRHRISLGDKLVTPGYISEFSWLSARFPHSLKGKRVLDIGANDGLNSFIAESRGASSITATDIYSESAGEADHQSGWNPHAIRLAQKHLQSKVEIKSCGVYELPELGSTFDVAILSDVVTWLPDIPKAIETISGICGECIVIREGVLKKDYKEGLIRYDHGKTGSHWYTPSLQFFRELLPEYGFKRVEIKLLSNAAMFDHWIRSFPIIHADKPVKLYRNPWTTEPEDELPTVRDQALMEVGGRYFLRSKGWVNVQEVRIEWIKPRWGGKILRSLMGEDLLFRMRDQYGGDPTQGATIIGWK